MDESVKRYGWECPHCGSNSRKHKARLFEDEKNCPVCKFDQIRRWPMRGKGSPPKDRKTYTIRLAPDVRELIEKRAEREGVTLSDAISRCIIDSQGPFRENVELRRLREWSCLLGVEKRNFSHNEGEVFNEIFYMSSERRLVGEEVLRDDNVKHLFMEVKDIEQVFGITRLVDDYTKLFCGLLAKCKADTSLWAYTFYIIYTRLGREIQFDDWIIQFKDGIPTRQALDRAWKRQIMTLKGGDKANFTQDKSCWSAK